MKAIERLYLYIEYKGLKPTIFESNIGFSSGYLSTQKRRNADLGESIILKINDYCQDLSLIWLLTGKGEMLKSTADQVEKIQPEAQSDTEKGLMELIHNNATLVETNKKLTDSLLNLTNRLLKDE